MQDANVPESKSSSGMKSISLAGLVFIYISVAMFALVGFLSSRQALSAEHHSNIEDYLPDIILSVIAVFAAVLGVGLVRAAGLAASVPNLVINPIEWDALKQQVQDGHEDAITQYVRLQSLTGFTGTFTKLGLQGLPLATIGLTIFFSLLFLENKEYLDLAKLTLGAFIGSFVQKQVGVGQGGGTIKLPSGETVKVSPSAPPFA